MAYEVLNTKLCVLCPEMNDEGWIARKIELLDMFLLITSKALCELSTGSSVYGRFEGERDEGLERNGTMQHSA